MEPSSNNNNFGAPSNFNSSFDCTDFSTIPNLTKINMNSYLFFSSNLNSMATQQHKNSTINDYNYQNRRNNLNNTNFYDIRHNSLDSNHTESFHSKVKHYLNNQQGQGCGSNRSFESSSNNLAFENFTNKINQSNNGQLIYLKNKKKQYVIDKTANRQNKLFNSSLSTESSQSFKENNEINSKQRWINKVSDQSEKEKTKDHNNNNEIKEKYAPIESATKISDLTVKQRPKSTYPFGKCKVCNDKATGIHYGIATCEGCKGFFKRCTLKKENYRCFFGNNCVITPKNRNRCKSCRFKKCLAVSMSIQGAKMGRIPKAIKEQAIKKYNEFIKTNVEPKEMSIEKSSDCLEDFSEYNESLPNSVHELNIDESENLPLDSSQPKINSNDFSNQFIDSPESQNNNIDKISLVSSASPTPRSPESNQLKLIKEIDNSEIVFSNMKICENQFTESSIISKSNHSSVKPRRNTFEIVSNKDNLDFNNIKKRDCLRTIDNKLIFPHEIFSRQIPFKSEHLKVKRFNSYLSDFGLKNSHSNQVILSLLCDKIYQLYIENMESISRMHERALTLIYHGNQIFNGHDPNIKEVWTALLESIPKTIKNLILFAKELPGIDELSEIDFNTIINNKAFEYFILKNAALFINNECFVMLPNNIQYTRNWMLKVNGVETTNRLFKLTYELNSLRLTEKEIALIFPLMLTTFKDDSKFEEPIRIKNLNKYYYNALLYELDLNKRDLRYLKTINQVITEVAEMKILKMSNEESMTTE